MAGIQTLEIPKWGLSMEEGTIVEWLIGIGDAFNEGQEICEIETSKIANVLEAPFSGTLRKIIAHPGDTLPVQAPIGLCAPADVSDADLEAFAATLAPAPAAEPAATPTAPVAQTATPVAAPITSPSTPVITQPTTAGFNIPDTLKTGDDDSAIFTTPRARKFAQTHGINLNQVSGTGRRDRISIEDIEAAIHAAGGSVPARASVPGNIAALGSTADDSGVKATPIARRLAKELGVNLNDCRGTDSRGRVSKADVEALYALRQNSIANPAQPITLTEAPAPVGKVEVQRMTGMRRTIANRLQQSKHEAPHFRVTIDCKIDALLATRKDINTYHSGAKTSVNDFVLKAAAMTLVKSAHLQCAIRWRINSPV